MFDADVQGVIGFTAIQRRNWVLIEKSRGVRIESISRGDAGALNSAAIRKIGARKDPDGLLPIGGKRPLREIINVKRGVVLQLASIGVVGRIIIVDAGQNRRGQPEYRIFDA